jgi:hypothetical protein
MQQRAKIGCAPFAFINDAAHPASVIPAASGGVRDHLIDESASAQIQAYHSQSNRSCKQRPALAVVPTDDLGCLGRAARRVENVQPQMDERGKEDEPVEVENSILTDLERVVSFREALYGMKLKHIGRPPDGFIVVDSDGKEVRRWFGSTGPNPEVAVKKLAAGGFEMENLTVVGKGTTRTKRS